MNSLKAVLQRLSDSDFEIAKSNQVLYSGLYESKASVEAGKSYVAALTKDVDIACPVMDSGWRQSDIDTLNSATDQRLINSIAANLSSTKVQSMDTTGLTNEQIADNSIPRNLDMSDLERLQDSIVPVPPVVDPPKTE